MNDGTMKWDETIRFNEALAPGQEVEARWTNNFRSYRTPAIVEKVNGSSLKVRLVTGTGPYAAGHVITLPRLNMTTLLRGWTVNNCAAPVKPVLDNPSPVG